jgi:hypothetical protein
MKHTEQFDLTPHFDQIEPIQRRRQVSVTGLLTKAARAWLAAAFSSDDLLNLLDQTSNGFFGPINRGSSSNKLF